MKRFGLLLSALVCLVVAGCAFMGKHPASTSSIDREVLLAGPPELYMPAPTVDILALDDTMRAFLTENVPARAHESQKAQLLIQAFFNDEGINIQYEAIETGTAIETFYARSGNCLSFTTLFVAAAREIGLDAHFQEVRTPPVWDSRGDLYIYNRHINVLLEYRYQGDQVVDFDMENFSEDLPRRKVSDKAAVAQYHNNMAVHWLLAEDVRQSLAHQRLALKMQPRAAFMWTNLGAIYSHFGYTDYAEAAYLTTLEFAFDQPVAMSNLARLYHRQGRQELASYYEEKAQASRNRNPFYLFARAQEHYADGEYLEARDELRRAVRLQRGDPQFYQLLGLVELQTGATARARKNFELARKYSEDPAQREHLNRKLQLLVGVNSQ
jgi:tetratricopeptide (TPR) repeat protein